MATDKLPERHPRMLPTDPAIRQVMKLLGIPEACTGFTLTVALGDVVRVSTDYMPRATSDGADVSTLGSTTRVVQP